MGLRFELITKIISPEGEHFGVYGIAKCISNDPDNIRYQVTLYCNKMDQPVGNLDFELWLPNTRLKKYNHLNLDNTLPCVHIIDMHNVSKFAHVGSALHEFAFRASIVLNAEGRINLEAVRDTHYFHYVHGFRTVGFPLFMPKVSAADISKGYYETLASALQEAHGQRIENDLGSMPLYLPKNEILTNLTKYNISATITDFETEDASSRTLFDRSELLIEEAKPVVSKLNH